MEISKEVIESAGLNEDQVTAINSYNQTQFELQEAKFVGKANEQAEGILGGAAKTIHELTGVERQSGQKMADYIKEASTTHIGQLKSTYETKITEYDEKIKSVKGNEALTAEFERAQAEVLTYKQQLADLEPLKGLDEKYNTLLGSSNKMKEDNAFNSVKPSIPSHLTESEKQLFGYKYNDWKNQLLTEYDIVYVNGEYKAQSKENELIIKPLDALLKENTELSALVLPREQKGINDVPAGEMMSADGVPFKIPKGASTKDLAGLIQAHLSKEGIDKMSNDYPVKFAELLKKSKLAIK